jgi:hypothetical protein
VGEWVGNVWPSATQVQIAVLDSGAALAVSGADGQAPTQVYLADMPVPPPANFQLNVTALDLSSATVSTQTWSVTIPSSNGLLIESSAPAVIEATRTHYEDARPLAALPGDWVLDLRTMGGALGPWPVTITSNGQFRYDGPGPCRASGRFREVASSQEWVWLHIVFNPECAAFVGGNSLTGLLRRAPADNFGLPHMGKPETLIGAAATGNRRNAVTVRGLRRPLP